MIKTLMIFEIDFIQWTGDNIKDIKEFFGEDWDGLCGEIDNDYGYDYSEITWVDDYGATHGVGESEYIIHNKYFDYIVMTEEEFKDQKKISLHQRRKE